MIFLNASVFLLDRYASFWSYVYSDLDNIRRLYIHTLGRELLSESVTQHIFTTFVSHMRYRLQNNYYNIVASNGCFDEIKFKSCRYTYINYDVYIQFTMDLEVLLHCHFN